MQILINVKACSIDRRSLNIVRIIKRELFKKSYTYVCLLPLDDMIKNTPLKNQDNILGRKSFDMFILNDGSDHKYRFRNEYL